jgi:hypothetical protein
MTDILLSFNNLLPDMEIFVVDVIVSDSFILIDLCAVLQVIIDAMNIKIPSCFKYILFFDERK